MRDFLRGVASILDIGGTLHRGETERILNRNDAETLQSDWDAVACDLHKVWQALPTAEEAAENLRHAGSLGASMRDIIGDE